MKIKVFLILSVFISCSTTKNSIIGTYSSIKQNWKDNLFINYEIWANGTTLNLEKDSSFALTSCGNTLKGDWKIKNDSLLLYIQSNKFNIDSLNHLPEWKVQLETENKKPYFYIIKKNKLYHKGTFIENGKTLIIVNNLIKK